MSLEWVQSLSERRKTRLKVAVVGDLLEDVYQYGHVSRISPEFPVPILRSPGERTEVVPGGAGNVAHQFSRLNCDVTLYGFADNHMREMLATRGFATGGLVCLTSGNNPRKVRFYDGDFPLLRWDIERDGYGNAHLHDLRWDLYVKILHQLKENRPDAVLLSNYGKGVFDEALAAAIIQDCRRFGVKTIVDPKSHPEWWQGCDIFKPNAGEAKSLCPHCPTQEGQIRELAAQVKCKAVVVTNAGGGVRGWDGEPFVYTPAVPSKEVASVIGAGDCFAAVLTFGVCHGLKVSQAAELAFQAGVQYVTERHNRPLTWYEIHRRIDPIGAKVISREDLLAVLPYVAEGQKVAFTNGCFDILHVGHLNTINYAKSFGHKLVVGINCDDSVRRLKGNKRPILSLADRAVMLANLEAVDFVVPFGEDTPHELISVIRPDVVVKGGEYEGKPIAPPGFTGQSIYSAMRENLSTTNIIKSVLEKYAEDYIAS